MIYDPVRLFGMCLARDPLTPSRYFWNLVAQFWGWALSAEPPDDDDSGLEEAEKDDDDDHAFEDALESLTLDEAPKTVAVVLVST